MPMGIGFGLGLRCGQGGGQSLFSPVDLGSAAIGWWDFRTSADLTLGGGNEISAAASKIGNIDMTQASGSLQPVWDANGYAVFDASNDYLEFTLSSGVASGQMYIQTTDGWYKSGIGNWTAVTHRFSSADIKQAVLVDAATITSGQEAELAAYFGGTEYYFIGKSSSTTLSNRIDNFPDVNYTLDYIGANAATYSEATSQNGKSVDLAAQGLTAAVRVLWPVEVSDDATIIRLLFNSNNIIGVIPETENLSAINFFWVFSNNITGIVPSIPPSVTSYNAYLCNLTGNIPTLAGNTVLGTFGCFNNQLTGYDGGGVSATLLTFRAENNLLPESAVDEILSDLDNAGATAGTVNVGGTGNSAPSAAGSSSAANLSGNGWTVTTN